MATSIDDAPNPDAERHNRDALHCVWDLHGGVWTCDEPECPEYRPEVHLEIDRRTGRREEWRRAEFDSVVGLPSPRRTFREYAGGACAHCGLMARYHYDEPRFCPEWRLRQVDGDR